jgi:hypothetical protein
MLHIHNDRKQGENLMPAPFNFALEYEIKKVQESQVELKLNGTHQLLVCADGVYLLGDSMNKVKKKYRRYRDAIKVGRTHKPA